MVEQEQILHLLKDLLSLQDPQEFTLKITTTSFITVQKRFLDWEQMLLYHDWMLKVQSQERLLVYLTIPDQIKIFSLHQRLGRRSLPSIIMGISSLVGIQDF